MIGDRLRLRAAFDSASELYQQARADYPERLYDSLIEATGISAGDRSWRSGAPRARRHFLSRAEAFGSRASRSAASWPQPLATTSPTFPTRRSSKAISSPGGNLAAFASTLVLAATVWHWIDPEVRYRRARELLRTGGHLAFWSAAQVFPEGGDAFFLEIQDVYDEIGEGLPADATWPRPGELPDSSAEVQRSGLFVDVTVRHFDWEISYDAEQYVRLLETFSGHISIEPWKRKGL
jgi:hypothetical protein